LTSNPVLVGSYNVNFPDLWDFIEEMMDEGDLDEMEEGLGEMGLTISDIKSAISGEIVYILDRIETKEVTWDYGYGDPYTYTTTEPVIGTVIKVSDRAVIEKALASLTDKLPKEEMDFSDMKIDDEELMALYEEMSFGPQIEEQANGVLKIEEAFMFLGKNVFFVCNDSAWAQKIAKGNGKRLKDPNGDLGKHPFAIYANFERLAKMDDLDEFEPFVKMFTEFSGGANLDEGHFSLKLKNKSENALRVLTTTITDAINEAEEKMNTELKDELDEALKGLDALEEDMEEGMECEGGACEAGACEAGACEGGK
jgi:hypothetical protein